MKKLIFGVVMLAAAIALPVPAMAGVTINIGIPLPPPIVFPAPPDVIVVPDTDYVYVVPDIEVDLFFWDGWWWRFWEGRWYRSRYYSRGWVYYRSVPTFYFDVDPYWRRHYRDHNWYGHRWDYDRIPNRRLERNWKSWRNDRYWERRGNWGVKDYRPRPHDQRRELRRQREEEYHRRPDVQRHREWTQEQQRRSRVQPGERGRSVEPQGAPAGRDERQRGYSPENRTHGGGPATGKESRRVRPGKKTKSEKTEKDRESKDERRSGRR